jgi:hypothetical protein
MANDPHFTISFNFTCEGCGNSEPRNFYIMPVEGIRKDNTFGFLDGKYRMVCQKCKEEFTTELTIRRFSDVSKE